MADFKAIANKLAAKVAAAGDYTKAAAIKANAADSNVFQGKVEAIELVCLDNADCYAEKIAADAATLKAIMEGSASSKPDKAADGKEGEAKPTPIKKLPIHKDIEKAFKDENFQAVREKLAKYKKEVGNNPAKSEGLLKAYLEEKKGEIGSEKTIDAIDDVIEAMEGEGIESRESDGSKSSSGDSWLMTIGWRINLGPVTFKDKMAGPEASFMPMWQPFEPVLRVSPKIRDWLYFAIEAGLKYGIGNMTAGKGQDVESVTAHMLSLTFRIGPEAIIPVSKKFALGAEVMIGSELPLYWDIPYGGMDLVGGGNSTPDRFMRLHLEPHVGLNIFAGDVTGDFSAFKGTFAWAPVLFSDHRELGGVAQDIEAWEYLRFFLFFGGTW